MFGVTPFYQPCLFHFTLNVGGTVSFSSVNAHYWAWKINTLKLKFYGCCSVFVDSLIIVALIVCGSFMVEWSLFCYVVRSVHSSFANISLRKRELVALL